MTIKCIFSINTGRSGSNYLSLILGATKNCESYHELAPTGFHRSLHAWVRGRQGPMHDVATAKVTQIAEANSRGFVFSDTSHAFIKGFGWPLITMLDPSEVAVIILNRDAEKIVRSYAMIGCLPLSKGGSEWTLTPAKMNPIVIPPRFLLPGRAGFYLAKSLSSLIKAGRKIFRLIGITPSTAIPLKKYQIAALHWYVEETKALSKLFQETYPEVSFIEIDVTDLNDPISVDELNRFLGLRPNPDQKDYLGIATNKKEPKKARLRNR